MNRLTTIRFAIIRKTGAINGAVEVAGQDRLPYHAFDEIDTALSFLSRAGAADRYQSLEDLSSALRFVQDEMEDVFLFRGRGPIIQINHGTEIDAHASIIFSHLMETIEIHGIAPQTVNMPLNHAAYFAAALGQRHEDRFPEVRDEEEVFKRRKVWTTACLAAAGALPCSHESFLAAAETIALAIEPRLEWDQTDLSRRCRVIAAIHAGIVLADARTGLLIAHPCVEGWRAIMEMRSKPDWTKLRLSARAFMLLPDRLKLAIRAWAMDRSGKRTASSHQLLAAEETLSVHNAEINFIRQEIYPIVSPLPMPPPPAGPHER